MGGLTREEFLKSISGKVNTLISLNENNLNIEDNNISKNIIVYQTDDGSILSSVEDYTLESLVNGKYEKIDLTTIDEKKIKQGIRETVQPVLDVQSKPLINLQWLFNKMYQDRFN